MLVLRVCPNGWKGIEAGTLRLVEQTRRAVYDEMARLLTDEAEYGKDEPAQNPYGEGHAAERIVKAIVDWEGCGHETRKCAIV